VSAFGAIAFQHPVQVVFAPGETTRAFVVEQDGTIAMVSDINNPVRQVILDLSANVNPPQNDTGHGMLSMVFHPNFAQNGFFYVWTSYWDSGSRFTRLFRYTLASNGTVDPASQETLISQPDGSGGHDGGTLLFGSDGYLYLSIGDGDEGVAGAEAIASHQRIDEGFYGAVLRIDVDQKPGNLVPNPHAGQQSTGYLVPADNPWVGATSFNGLPVNPTSVRTEFWAVGFRNPFRMSFDSANGDLWVGDVGLEEREEIDVATKGANYGWNFYEGDIPGPAFASLPTGITFTPPVWVYNHDAGDICVIGGLVYHGALFPELQGQYLFADYLSGRIWTASSPATRPFQAAQISQISSIQGVCNVTVQPVTGDILLVNQFYGLIQKLGSPSPTQVPPLVSAQPASQSVATGGSVTLSVGVTAVPAATFQWSVNGTPIAGATSASLVLQGVTAASSGSYACFISNAVGSIMSGPATLTVEPASELPRLINISTRAQVGTGANILIPGFVIGGNGMETLLIRADGPALAQFGISGLLAKPSLSVIDSAGSVVATNTGWGTNTNPAQIAAAAAAAGAFALAPGSADCALVANLAPGAYSVQVSGLGNTTGVALAEVYEMASGGTRLINISTRAQVGTGSGIIIPGFVISGVGTEQLLARGDGPSLSAFGVSGALAQPSLSVFDSTGAVIATNTGWSTAPNAAQVASVAASVNAYPLPAGSADSALIVDLAPGSYTMQVSGTDSTTGVGLAELYEIP
jgi:glucose/arabinose dehydrogenase/inosine/xanthosine triphosphate pyrophosphatase family protein